MKDKNLNSMSIICLNGEFKTIPDNRNYFYLFIARFIRFWHGFLKTIQFIFSPPEKNTFKHRFVDAFVEGETYVFGLRLKFKITTFIGCMCGKVYYARLFSKEHNLFSPEVLEHLDFFQVTKALNYQNKYEKELATILNNNPSVLPQVPLTVIKNEPSEWMVGNWVWFLEYFKDVEPNNDTKK